MQSYYYFCYVFSVVGIGSVVGASQELGNNTVESGSSPVVQTDDNMSLPGSRHLDPTVVQQFIKITDLITVSDGNQQAELIMELVQQWNGGGKETLAWISRSLLHNAPPPPPMEQDEESEDEEDAQSAMKMKQIVFVKPETLSWVPDPIKIVNFRNFEVLNEQHLKLPQNRISKQQRVKLTVGCKMFTSLFPYDSHLCSIILSGNYGDWIASKAPLCDRVEGSKFYVKGYTSIQTGTQYVLHLIVSRSSSMQIFSQMYSPVILLSILSLFTLYFGSYVFRIGLSVACLLFLILITTIFWRDIPRNHTGHPTAIEHYFAIFVGLMFQIAFTNILMYGYLSCSPSSTRAHDEDVEADKANKMNCDSIATNEPNEEHILKMGKFHTFFYFKCLKPTKRHLPIAFLLINIIYWSVLLGLSSGLPTGFQYPQKECI